MTNARPWTAEDMPDLSGKTVIVTGGNSGIGYEAALQFARKRAHTILACRSLDKANAAAAQIVAASSGAAVEVAWDPILTPYIGIWACNGDLGGYRQIAIEPATGGGDRPHLAVPPPLLDPGAELSWWLEIRDTR